MKLKLRNSVNYLISIDVSKKTHKYIGKILRLMDSAMLQKTSINFSLGLIREIEKF